MQSEEEEEGPCEWFGVLRIPLKPGTASGYVGVQRNKSKASGAFPHLLASAGVPGRPGNIAAVLWDGGDGPMKHRQPAGTHQKYLINPSKPLMV